jgi:hypothetical protein
VEPDAATRGALRPARHLPALAGYAVITVALTWPLILSPGSLVPSDLGDPLLTASILWWNAQHLPFTDAWWDGTFFFPSTDSLALSDHRVGIGLFSTPLLWMGASPLTAYGVTFLLTWWLSAVSAYALAWTLTSSRAAAFAAGLVFGFNPFRAGHLAHLELLASYALPVVLLALHRWLVTRRVRWLIVLSAAMLLQALTSGYYFFFMGVLVALWLVWFARGLLLREYGVLALALATPIILLSPVLLHYRQVHEAVGLARSINEIKLFSADLIGLVTAPGTLALWKSPEAWHRHEGDIMPGVVAVLLVVMAAVIGRRRLSVADHTTVAARLRRVPVVIALAAIVVAVLPLLVGPMGFSIAGIRVSSSGQDKPLAIAFICGLVWLATSRRFVAAFTSRSTLAFYGVATAAMWLLAFGPEVRLLGHPVIYKAPYSWLMLLPGFADSFRAPARFAMLAVLALSAAASLAIVRLTSGWPRRTQVLATAGLAAAILAESWIYPFPLVPAPAPLELPPGVPASSAVLELPIGVYEDALAMFHTTAHHHRTLNGMSGYVPSHYRILERALDEGDAGILTVARRYADLVVFSRRDHADATALMSRLRTAGDATPLADTTSHHVTLLPLQPSQLPPSVPPVAELIPTAISTVPGVSSPPALMDGDPRTAWHSGQSQTGSEVITLTLAEARAVSGVLITIGPHVASFARLIAIDVSVDGKHWETAATAMGGTAALEAALRNPGLVEVTIRFEPRQARHVRIRQTGQAPDEWAVGEVRVLVPVE